MQEHFETHLQKFIQTENLSSVLEQTLANIRQPQFTISDIGVTHRWITHWDSKKLLLIDKPKRSWRTFDITEFIWLRMIVKLRALGVELDRIKMIKKVLGASFDWSEMISDNRAMEVARKTMGEDLSAEKTDSEIFNAVSESSDHPLFQIRNWMELLTLDMLITKEPISLIVTWNGQVFPHRWTYPMPSVEPSSSLNGFYNHSFISICLNDLLAEFLARQTKVAHEHLPDLFSESEWRLLLEISQGNASEVIVKLKDGNIQMLEISENVKLDRSARLGEILLNQGYQNLELKTSNGEIITARLTDKVKYS